MPLAFVSSRLLVSSILGPRYSILGLPCSREQLLLRHFPAKQRHRLHQLIVDREFTARGAGITERGTRDRRPSSREKTVSRAALNLSSSLIC